MPEQMTIPGKYQRDIPVSELGDLLNQDFFSPTGPISCDDAARFAMERGIVKTGDNGVEYVDGEQFYEAVASFPGLVRHDKKIDEIQHELGNFKESMDLALDVHRKYADTPKNQSEIGLFVSVLEKSYSETECANPDDPFEVKRAEYNREFQQGLAEAKTVTEAMVFYHCRLLREHKLLHDKLIELSTREGNRAELKALIEETEREGREAKTLIEKLASEQGLFNRRV